MSENQPQQPDQLDQPDQPRQWAIVELFGHTKLAGEISEHTIGGCSFVRIDVPAVGSMPRFTKLQGNSSIYGITFVTEEVLSYLDHEGAMPKKLSLTWDDRVSFVICADLSIKRLKFLDLVQSEAMEQEVESVEERFAADFAIMSGELRKVLARLTDVFVIETELEDVA
jgi:hypothetical protein